MNAARQAEAYRLISKAFTILADACTDEALEGVKVPMLASETDRDLWRQARVLLAMEGQGGDVHRDEFYSYGDYVGYSRQGLGGFSTTGHRLVECKGDRRIITTEGRQRLQEAKTRWPDYFGAGG